ncbi:response regulator [bacterium]|nr:response regulator [bacterium]
MSQSETDKKTVLIADDEPDLREVMEDGLKAFGFSVVTAVDGRNAVFQALRDRPDLVLMDVMMPGVTGIEALGIFKILHPLRSVPILMLTALKSREDVLAAIRAGAADYIAKPFDLKIISKKIAQILAQPTSAPPQIFRYLQYSAAASDGGLTLHLFSDLTPESADDLLVLAGAIAPLQPIRLMLDLEHVPAIQGRLLKPLSMFIKSVERSGGTITVDHLDPKKHRTATGLIRNLFHLREDPAKQAARADTIVRTSAANVDFRYTVRSKKGVAIMELFGMLTGTATAKIDRAFSNIQNAWAPLIVCMDGLTYADGAGMKHLVEKLLEIKLGAGLKVSAFVMNPTIRKSFLEARGHLVSGFHDRLEEALDAFQNN